VRDDLLVSPAAEDLPKDLDLAMRKGAILPAHGQVTRLFPRNPSTVGRNGPDGGDEVVPR